MVDLNKIKIDMVYTWVDNKAPEWKKNLHTVVNA